MITAFDPILSDVAAKTVNALYQNFIKRLKNLLFLLRISIRTNPKYVQGLPQNYCFAAVFFYVVLRERSDRRILLHREKHGMECGNDSDRRKPQVSGWLTCGIHIE